MLSVAEVCELQPGDEQNATWINPGFTGVVRKITTRKAKSGKDFFPCTIGDTTGSAAVEVSFFTRPNFQEGDQIELSGSGLRRTEYNGKPQAAIGKSTAVHVIGKSVHAAEQAERAEKMEPAINGAKQPVHGQTVGMAMKEALILVRASHPERVADVDNPDFWKSVHKTASTIIRMSNALEHGNLTPALGAAPAKPAAPANGQAFPTDGPADDSIPF